MNKINPINKQISEFAPVLNSPTIKDDVSVSSDNKDVPVAVMAKRDKNTRYIFAVAMRDGKTNVKFAVRDLGSRRTIEVLGENRAIVSKDGVFRDSFKSWDVHLYRIEDKSSNLIF